MRRCALLLVVTAVPATASCLLHGRVVDDATGKPLAGAQVFARLHETVQFAAIRRLSNSEGDFCFEQLDAADYDLFSRSPGYLDQGFGANAGRLDGTTIEVRKEELGAFTIKMSRTTSLSVTVSDSNGDLLESAPLFLWRKTWDQKERRWGQTIIDQSDTDDRGVYRFRNLPPGTYYLSAGEPSRDASLRANGLPFPDSTLPAYYPGTFSFQRATAIPIEAGDAKQVSFHLPGHADERTIVARLAPGLKFGPNAALRVESVVEKYYLDARGLFQKDGSIALTGLLADRYWLETEDVTPDVRMKVDLTDRDAMDLVLKPDETRLLRVALRGVPGIDPAFDVKARNIATGETTRLEPFHSSPTTITWEAELTPTTYDLIIPSSRAFVRSIVIQGKIQATHEIDLREGGLNAEGILSRSWAGLTGHIEGAPRGKSAAVVWLDEDHLLGGSRKINLGGTFDVPQIAPGRYRVFAIEDFDEDLWGSPELAGALREKSVLVTLQEGERQQVTLPLITAEEWEKALRKAGM